MNTDARKCPVTVSKPSVRTVVAFIMKEKSAQAQRHLEPGIGVAASWCPPHCSSSNWLAGTSTLTQTADWAGGRV